MKVSDLIKQLQKCNQDAEVHFVYDDCDGLHVDEEVWRILQKTFIEKRDEDQRTIVELL